MSPDDTFGVDVISVIGLAVVFALPLTLLLPDFSIWDAVPKIRVIRFHAFSQYLTWGQLNSALVVLLVLFFCIYLEIKKRKLDDMVESVMSLSEATNKTMEVENEKQAAAVRVCVDLLDVNASHYENVVLLREELRWRRGQHPPTIEPSTSGTSL